MNTRRANQLARSGQWAKGQSPDKWMTADSEYGRESFPNELDAKRMYSTYYKKPFEYTSCDFCYEEALWWCECCHIKYCHFDDCKKRHEGEHFLAVLAI